MRNYSIDIAKGLGIFLVVFGHNTVVFPVVFKLIYSFHMPLFFFLAGIFHKKNESLSYMIKSKAKRLITPYVFFSLFHYVFYLLWSLIFLDINNYHFVNIFKIIPLKDAISVPLWFFISLFEVIIIYHCIIKYLSKFWARFFIIIGLALMSYVINHLDLPFYYNYFHFFSSLSMLLFYFLGYEFFNSLNKDFFPEKNFMSIILFVILSFLLYGLNMYSNGVDINSNTINAPFYIYFASAFTGTYLILLLAKLINRSEIFSKFWIYIGKHSLGIFALHLAIFEFSRPISNVFFKDTLFINKFFGAVLCLFISIVLDFLIRKTMPRVYGIKKKSIKPYY